jgi:hypothetical protein
MKPRADVILTGHMRTFTRCLHSQRWHVYRHYDVAAFYVSTVQDEDTDGALSLLRQLYPDTPVHVDIVTEQPTLPEPVETVRFEPYARSVPVQAVLRQLWQLERGWALRQEAGWGVPIVIRMRPDLFFHSFSRPYVEEDFAQTPYWGRFGGVNDRFAILGQKAAPYYFKTICALDYLLEGGCPLHPESLVKASLEQGGVTVMDTMQTEFSTVRKNGEVRPPEISHMDLCHCGLNDRV